MNSKATYYQSEQKFNSDLVIVLTTYDQEKYIRRAVASLLNQTYASCHIILFDDASSDQTATIALELLSSQSEKTWQAYVQNENLGVELHHTFRASKIRGILCEYICFCEGDDWWMPNRFERQLTVFEGLPDDVSLVFSSLHVVNEKDEVIDLMAYNENAQKLTQLDFIDEGPVNPNPSTIYRFKALMNSPTDSVVVPDCFDCIDFVRTVHSTSDSRLGYFLPEIVGFYRRAEGISGKNNPWRAWVDLQHLNACSEFFHFYPEHAAIIFRRYVKVLMKMGFNTEQLSTHPKDDGKC